MGVRGMDQHLEQWQMGVKDLRRRMVLAPTRLGRGTVVRGSAASPGLDGSRHGGGLGAGPSYHWPVGCRLRRGRASGLDI